MMSEILSTVGIIVAFFWTIYLLQIFQFRLPTMFDSDPTHVQIAKQSETRTVTRSQTARTQGDNRRLAGQGAHFNHTERQNLTMRMQMRRFTRLTNAFSKKIENHEAAIALHYMHYNFARIHQTLRVTPAMESGISDHVWSLEEIVNLLP